MSIVQSRIQRGGWGLSPPPGPENSIEFRGFSDPKRVLSSPQNKFLNTPLPSFLYN